MAIAKLSKSLKNGTITEIFSQVSASGAAQTLSTDTDGVRRLVKITIKYSGGSPSGTATLTLNSVVGAGFDTLEQSIAIGGTDTVYLPSENTWITDGDAWDLVVPLLAAQTSSAIIYTERLS